MVRIRVPEGYFAAKYKIFPGAWPTVFILQTFPRFLLLCTLMSVSLARVALTISNNTQSIFGWDIIYSDMSR